MKAKNVLRSIAVAVVVLATALGISACFGAPRAALARTAAAVYLWTKGFQLDRVDLSLGGGVLDAHDVVVTDRATNQLFFSARRITAHYGTPGRALGLSDVFVDRPHLALHRETDGTYDIARLTGGNGGGSTSGAPLRVIVSILHGTVDVLNPSSPSIHGRGFSLKDVQLGARMAQGSTSTAAGSATLLAAGRTSPITFDFFENDVSRTARATVRLRGAPIAPLIDELVSSPAFIVEDGLLDAHVNAYALSWRPGGSPQWHLLGTGNVSGGRFRVIPLVVPLREVRGPLRIADGVLDFPAISATAAGVPIVAAGTVELFDNRNGPVLGLAARASGPYGRLRRWLAFSTAMPVMGSATVGATIMGPAASPHVDVNIQSDRGLRYGAVRVGPFGSRIYYHDGHVDMRDTFASYNGASVYGSGDIDITATPMIGQFVVHSKAPTRIVPWLADLDARGITRAEAALSGPLQQMSGTAFAYASGGPTRIRAVVDASPDRLIITSLLSDPHGGNVLAAGERARAAGSPVSTDLYAKNFSLRLNGRSVTLPGITRSPIGVPPASALLDGLTVVRGTADAPAIAVSLRANNTDVNGVRLGRIAVGAAGVAPTYHVDKISIRGPDTRLDATGNVAILPGQRGQSVPAGSVHGNATINLRRMRPAHGSISGAFAAAFDGDRWLGETQIRGNRAFIGSVPVGSLDGVVGASDGRITVYAATASVAGGEIAAQGTLPNDGPGKLTILVPRIDLASLRGSGIVPLDRGAVVGAATIAGTEKRPDITANVALSNGALAGREVAMDANVSYAHGRLTASGGRVVMNGSMVDVSGSIEGVARGQAMGNAKLSLDAAMPEGDLATLSSAVGPSSVPLTGIASIRAHVGGTLASPLVAGQVAVGEGTVRGVDFGDLGATFAASRGRVDMPAGSVRFGSSRLDVSGTMAAGSLDMRASSRHVDLDDFNNFFNGKDVLEGRGAFDLSLASSAGTLGARGIARLHDAGIVQIPLGDIDARLSPLSNGAAADIRQKGLLESAHITGQVAFARAGGSPLVDARAEVRDLNMAALAPYVGQEDLGLGGTANANVRAYGPMRSLTARADFNVANGRVHQSAIRTAQGTVVANSRGVQVRSLRIGIDGATLDVRGRYEHNGRFAAHAVANVGDLGAVARFARKPANVRGSALAVIDAAGTLRAPRVRARVNAGYGEVENVGYDVAQLDAAYGNGKIVTTGAIDFTEGHGALRLSASVPVMLSPLRIGPNDKPLALTLAANGVGLAFLNPILGSKVALAGSLDGNTTVRGTVGRPRLSGTAQLRGVTVRSQYDKVPITNLAANITFDQDAITISDLRAIVGTGTLDLHGAGHVVPATALRRSPSLQYYARAALHGADVDVPNLLAGNVDANLILTKSGAVPYLAGTVGFNNTAVPFVGILALASSSSSRAPKEAVMPGLPPVLPHHIIVYGGSVFGEGPDDRVLRPTPAPKPMGLAVLPPAVDLGLSVAAEKRVAVTGLLNVTGTGTVKVTGDTTAPKLDGTITALRGRAGFLNAHFELLDGSVTFNPADGFLPTVLADAMTRTDEADITVSVTGRVDQLHTDLISDPEMSHDAILATLLHVPEINSALASAQGQQQSSLGVSPGNLMAGQIAGQILSSLNVGLERIFNVEEVNFALDQFGNPSLELRKQVSPRAYTLYRTTFTVPPAQAFGIAYQVRRELQIIFTQSQSTPGIFSSYAVPQTSIAVKVTFH